MEARIFQAVVLAASLASLGARHQTTNFVVSAPTAEMAVAVGQNAERYRHDLAIEWLGHVLRPWPQPCPIAVKVGSHLGAGGATSFAFSQGQPLNWTMSIQGSRERILDSVLPHEVTHTIFATHFGRPLPRWADEGACTTMEHVSERRKQHEFLLQFLTTGRGIAFNRMFAMSEYPRDILPLYAQGYSLCRYLIAQRGRRVFVEYIGDGMRSNDWNATTRQYYGFRDLSDLQVSWVQWVGHGSRNSEAAALLASRTQPRGDTSRQPSPPVVRAQNDPPRNVLGLPFRGRRRATSPANVMPVSWFDKQDSPRPAVRPRTDTGGKTGRSWYLDQRARARRANAGP